MQNGRRSEISASRMIAVFLFVVIAAVGYFFGPKQSRVLGTNLVPDPLPTPRRTAPKPATKRKYSEFPHDAKAHQIDCASCHKFPSDNWNKVRSEKDAFPDITDYPKHESCLNCHRQQFFKGRPPIICSICHTNPGPRNSSRHPFPNPREIFDLSTKGKRAESDFVVGFPHDKHIEIVSRNSADRPFVNASFTRENGRRAGEESCVVCHQTYKPLGDSKEEYLTPTPAKLGDAFWLKKGTFKTTPIGHTTCFTCHSADSGLLPAPENCAACHRLKPAQPTPDFEPSIAAPMKIDDKRMMDLWRRRDSSGKFQHEFVAHVDASCSTCHNVQKIDTADPSTKKVSISACATCHATATSDDGGILNFEVDARKAKAAFQCVKCHITLGKLPIPESHNAAIAAAGK